MSAIMTLATYGLSLATALVLLLHMVLFAAYAYGDDPTTRPLFSIWFASVPADLFFYMCRVIWAFTMSGNHIVGHVG
jgi:hypothetical protein